VLSGFARQETPQPTFRTEANYVRVDIYPSADGAPILDLRPDEIEILDNGVPQAIDRFEHVQVAAAGPQETRIEPNTVAESRAMASDPRARVFVIFLDTYHVAVAGSHDIRRPLVDALNRVIGDDDLVAVMTPEMSAADLAFARKTASIEEYLTRYWTWGRRDQRNSYDPEEEAWWRCFPGDGPTSLCPDDDRGVAAAMIDRRREWRTLSALHDLVRVLRGVREERKAAIVITEGWLLYRPDAALKRRLACGAPTGPEIFVDPRTGRLTTTPPPGDDAALRSACDLQRLQLAEIDDEELFRRMLDEANRSNTSFYPVDPRGLHVFDTEIVPVRGPSLGPAPMVPPSIDSRMLHARNTSLRTMADATDGLAIVGTNDLDSGLRRVVSDLTSYYLVGFYTTETLDGKFHRLTVRVKRPGVEVRARRGYLAPTPEEVARAAAAAATASGDVEVDALSQAVSAAIAPLDAYVRPAPLRVDTMVAGGRLLLVGEIGRTSIAAGWTSGGDVDLLVVDSASGDTVAGRRLTVAAGARVFELDLPAPPAGTYEVTLRARGRSDRETMTGSEQLQIDSGEAARGVRVVRRGPSTANRETVTADRLFRRNETIRFEWPVGVAGGGGGATAGADASAARLLDRTGRALAVPVGAGARDAGGTRWLSAELALAALAPGDYVVERASNGERRLAAFRVVP
jgi:VWFA-related protein